MYRLVLYGLTLMAVYAIVAGFLGQLSYGGWSLLVSLVILCFGVGFGNYIFAKLFKAPANIESQWISAFILFFVLTPTATFWGADAYILLAAAVLAMASKYVFAYHKKHIFNPVAVSLVIIALVGNGQGSWWVGTPVMLPIALIVGLLIVRKIRRFSMFWSFIVTSIATIIFVFNPLGISIQDTLKGAFLSFPVIFFATIMLTEPLTMPPSRKWQIVYGAIVGILFSLPYSLGPIYSSPEIALVIGNIFSYIVSSKRRYIFTLKSRTQLSPLIHDFAFTPDAKVEFKAGQYMEWTFPHEHPDTRGNRRFFTVASSPTEPEVHLGVRIQQDGSSFKDALLSLETGGIIAAGSLSGDFTLPNDQNIKLAFVAGGIGVTPFRSMIKYLVDTKQKRDVTLFYACAAENDFVYKDIFTEAERKIGLKVVYIVTDAAKISEQWKGKTGYLTKEIISEVTGDFSSHVFYLSGPDAMVQNYKKMVLKSGVKRSNVRTDYFPGF